MKITVTGSSGFIGKQFHSLSRHTELDAVPLRNDKWREYRPTSGETMIYLAGLAHQKKNTPSESYFHVNFDLPLELCRRLKSSGGKHFIYLSSSKVYGDAHSTGKIYSAKTPAWPDDAYGQSKLSAETSLLTMNDPSFKVTIIRIPLVYGPGVKGNFKTLLDWIRRFPFLPFGGVRNLRSYIYVGNLVHALDTLVDSSPGGILLLSDPRPLSTTELIQIISRYMGKSIALVAMPAPLLRIIKLCFPGIYRRLWESLVLETDDQPLPTAARPPFSPEQGLERTVAAYLAERHRPEKS